MSTIPTTSVDRQVLIQQALGQIGTKSPTAYKASEAVKREVNAVKPSITEQQQASLQRLDRALNSGEGLREDVPRGFYLNITV